MRKTQAAICNAFECAHDVLVVRTRAENRALGVDADEHGYHRCD